MTIRTSLPRGDCPDSRAAGHRPKVGRGLSSARIRTRPRGATLATLLAIAGLAFVVRAGTSANEDRPAKPTANDRKTAEAEIWALEQAYWQFNRDANHEGIISTWHDQFLGWPEGEPRPIDKKEGTRFVRQNYAEPASYSFEIEPTGIVVLDNVAVNHYTIHLKPSGAEAGKKQRSMRITHTWIRDRAGWKILGGMSASP